LSLQLPILDHNLHTNRQLRSLQQVGNSSQTIKDKVQFNQEI